MPAASENRWLELDACRLGLRVVVLELDSLGLEDAQLDDIKLVRCVSVLLIRVTEVLLIAAESIVPIDPAVGSMLVPSPEP